MATNTNVNHLTKKDLEKVQGKIVEVKRVPYVLLPASALAKLIHSKAPRTLEVKISARKGSGVPRGSVEASAFMRNEIAVSLKAARQEAKLTQEQLAAKLHVSQSRIAQTEGGLPVSGAYLVRVLKACGLPEDWKPNRKA